MREKLEKIGSEERHRFRGTFERFGEKKSFGHVKKTVLLVDITDLDGNLLTDHLWFNFTKGFEKVSPRAGDILEFDARVTEYEKGYRGYRDDVFCPLSWDYRLSNPTKIVKIK